MCHKRDLTDQQWKILGPLVPEPARRRDGRGRPWKERRAVLNGILWVLRTGAPWVEVPDRYPWYPTCHGRFQQWGPVWSDERNSGGSCCRAQNPRPDRRRRGLHRWEFRTIEKRGSKIGKTKRGKGSKIMAVADRHGLPVALCVESATPHDVKLATNTLVQMVIPTFLGIPAREWLKTA